MAGLQDVHEDSPTQLKPFHDCVKHEEADLSEVVNSDSGPEVRLSETPTHLGLQQIHLGFLRQLVEVVSVSIVVELGR